MKFTIVLFAFSLLFSLGLSAQNTDSELMTDETCDTAATLAAAPTV
jgi:hypothetical protein